MKKLLFLLLSSFIGCGFASDDDIYNTNIDGPTKYKKIYVGTCSYRMNVEAYIPDEYAHWRKNLHSMSALFGSMERAEYSTWDSLSVSVPCSSCLTGVYGMVSVLDSKNHWMPWGCGQERPPLIVTNVTTTFIDRKGAVALEDEANSEWKDSPYPVYKHSFIPELISSKDYCDNEPVLLDLNEACKVLVQAGALEELK